METYIDTTGEEAAEEEAAVKDAVGNVAQLHVLHTTGAEVADGAVHADGTKRDEADDDNLRPWRIVCGLRLAFPIGQGRAVVVPVNTDIEGFQPGPVIALSW